MRGILILLSTILIFITIPAAAQTSLRSADVFLNAVGGNAVTPPDIDLPGYTWVVFEENRRFYYLNRNGTATRGGEWSFSGFTDPGDVPIPGGLGSLFEGDLCVRHEQSVYRLRGETPPADFVLCQRARLSDNGRLFLGDNPHTIERPAILNSVAPPQ